MVRIEELGFSRRDRRRFMEVEFRLNRHDPLWVPPLRLDRMNYTDPRKNPFFKHAEVAHFVAVVRGRDVGRIAAIRNHRHEEFQGERVGFFGFLETIEDAEVLRALLDAASAWLSQRGLLAIRGPVSYDTNSSAGMLVEPFDSPPRLLMPYNREFLPRMIEEAGFGKAMDLLAYFLESHLLPDRVRRLAERLRKREGIQIRQFRKNRLDEEVRIVQEIYNQAWEKNWGFVPLTDEEIQHQAKDLAMLLDPHIFLFAEVGERPVAFSMCLPDINQVLRRIRSGRLFPTGLIRLLLGKRKVDTLRLLTLGILPEYRNRGVDILLYTEGFERASRGGYVGAECSWILETNRAMNRGLEALGGTVEKRYRVYERPL